MAEEERVKTYTQPIEREGENISSVGYDTAYPTFGDISVGNPSRLGREKSVYTFPVGPQYMGARSGANVAAMDHSNVVRNPLLNRPKRSEKRMGERPSFMFGDVSVDPSIVQNVDHAVWPIGPRNGMPSRIINRNLENLCK